MFGAFLLGLLVGVGSVRLGILRLLVYGALLGRFRSCVGGQGFFGRNKRLLPLRLALLGMLGLSFELLGVLLALFLVRLEEVLAALQLQIDLARLLRRGKGRVYLLFRRLLWLFRLHTGLLELGQEALPGLVSQLGVLGEFTLDHQLFDMVDGMDVLHAVQHNAAHFFQTLVRAHGTHRIALNQHIAPCEKLDGLQRATIRTDDALPSLHKTLLVAHNVPNFDDIARHVVLQDLDGLCKRDAAAQQLDQVTRTQDDVRIKSLPGGAHRHGSLNKIQCTGDAMLVQSRGNMAPDFTKILFTVLGEKRRKTALFQERMRIVFSSKLIHLPVVDIIRVPSCISISTYACPCGNVCSCFPPAPRRPPWWPKKWLTSSEHARSMTALRAEDALPLGVVLVRIESGLLTDEEIGEDVLELSASHLRQWEACSDDRALIGHLAELRQDDAAVMTIERDVWNLWCAGMYTGTVRVRIYARIVEHKTPRKGKRTGPVPPSAKHWQAVLPHLCIDASEWHALSRESDTLTPSSTMFWVPGVVCDRHSLSRNGPWRNCTASCPVRLYVRRRQTTSPYNARCMLTNATH